MLIASFLSITLVPALLIIFSKSREIKNGPSWFVKTINFILTPHSKSEEHHPISKFLFKTYGPCVDWVVENRKKVLLIAGLLIIATVPVYFKLGSEFGLNESDEKNNVTFVWSDIHYQLPHNYSCGILNPNH